MADSTAERPAKRARKIFHACDQCTMAKARCDTVDEEGCNRCRQRAQICSLAGVGPGSAGFVNPAPHRAPGWSVPSTNEQLSNLRARVEMLEAQAAQAAAVAPVMTTNLDAGEPISLQVVIQPRAPDTEAFRKAIAGAADVVSFSERSFTVLDASDYPDIVDRGLVTPAEMDLAFQMFKHRFIAIFPYAPYFSVSEPTPKHAFVRLAVLAFVPEMAPANLNVLVDESVLYAMTGAFTEDAMLALFILSFAPMHVGSAEHVPLSPTRLIGLAYQMGHSLGLHWEAYHHEGGAQKLLLLWESISRHNMFLQLLTCQIRQSSDMELSVSPVKSSAGSTFDPTCDLYSSMWLHLRVHGEVFIEIDRLVLRKVASCEECPRLNRKWSPEMQKANAVEMDRLLKSWDEMMISELWCNQKCGSWRTNRVYIAFALSTRILTLLAYQGAPWLDPDVRGALSKRAAMNCIEYANELVKTFCVALTPPGSSQVYPAYAMTLAIAAMSMLRRTAIILTKLGASPENDGLVDMETLQKAEQLAAELPGLPSKVLRGMWDSLDEDKKARGPDGEFDWSLLEEFYQSIRENEVEDWR